ncbi:hypothetical protein [Paenibacillus sacheonensis]|uniref:Uncharacterized protein n=1 Tax=Paenibacillus sacheonensis TaxID=742054 RepID=A0A7X4YMU5_9BACL|nr:hypothetical protein [Paenibacillus sacheonensis]MBM7563157.1 hypothetical protein [Paenibacillus sacheonensis]NBC68279.1 hypothetical protein [Paenibacillus sacheonensis]
MDYGLTLGDWVVYTMWGVFGFLILDFVIAFARSFWSGAFNTTFLDYLKDIVFYVVPLNFILSMTTIDPTHYTLIVLYFIGGASVMIKYVTDIVRKFRTDLT